MSAEKERETQVYLAKLAEQAERFEGDDNIKAEEAKPAEPEESNGMSEKDSESVKVGSDEVSREFKTLVSSDDLHALNHLQHTILGRLQDSTAVLSHFNDFSQNCFDEISGNMARNTRQLKTIKSDLDYIFLKLRSMKTRIMATYPDAFPEDSMTEVIDRRPDLEMPK